MGYEVILLAAGQGKRMKASYNKILLHLMGVPVISYSLKTFFNDSACEHIILVTQEDEQVLLKNLVKKIKQKKVAVSIVTGGSERQYSVYHGLKAVKNLENVVMVHDGARPFVTLEQLKLLYKKTKETGSAILGVPVKDTIKKVIDGVVQETIPRDTLWQIQTPQSFMGKDLMAAHEQALKEDFLGTDESSLIEKYTDLPVSMVLGSYENIKLTTPEDMLIGEAIAKRKRN